MCTRNSRRRIPGPATRVVNRDCERVNRVQAFSGAVEKSGGKERKRVSRGDRTVSPNCGAENGIVRNCLALLGILREAGTGARDVRA